MFVYTIGDVIAGAFAAMFVTALAAAWLIVGLDARMKRKGTKRGGRGC